MRVINSRTGEQLPGIPTAMLASLGGGNSYFSPNPNYDPNQRGGFNSPGVWYAHQPERGYAPKDGSLIVRVAIQPDREFYG